MSERVSEIFKLMDITHEVTKPLPLDGQSSMDFTVENCDLTCFSSDFSEDTCFIKAFSSISF